MAITPQSAIQVSDDGELLVPAMAAQPLQAALENLNYLWQWHWAPLVDVCPNVDPATSRDTLVYPILPSGEGLRYTFEHTLETEVNTTVDVSVEYCTTYAGGGTTWHALYTATTPTTTAGAPYTQVDANIAIPYNAEALRIQFESASGDYFPHHILAYPSPDAPGPGITTLGFTPFDDGLLGSTDGAAVHTEFLNRCKESSLIVLRDRRQQVLSFLQKETGTPLTVCSYADAWPTDDYQDLPRVRLVFPFQSPTVLVEISVLADVSGGSTVDMVRVRQVGIADAELATFDADFAISTRSLKLTLQGTGLYRWADVAIGARCTNATTTKVRAVSGCWRPGD